jgi:hypothetical protein
VQQELEVTGGQDQRRAHGVPPVDGDVGRTTAPAPPG